MWSSFLSFLYLVQCILCCNQMKSNCNVKKQEKNGKPQKPKLIKDLIFSFCNRTNQWKSTKFLVSHGAMWYTWRCIIWREENASSKFQQPGFCCTNTSISHRKGRKGLSLLQLTPLLWRICPSWETGAHSDKYVAINIFQSSRSELAPWHLCFGQ